LKVGVVDIGTNSMRLLLADGSGDLGRWEEVTGLGRSVDATGELSESAISDSLTALARYGSLMDEAGVTKRAAVATSASRGASNREVFFDRVEQVLGVRPALISGEEEAALAYAGATRDLNLPGPVVVSDIGGGSTEFATEAGGVSVEIGSVRLTERHLPNRPASSRELTGARAKVARLFAAVEIPRAKLLVGVAGTWTSLAAIVRDSPSLEEGTRLSKEEMGSLVDDLAALTIEETADIPNLHPARAPVILSGAVVAAGVMEVTGAEEAHISGHDTLDGVAMNLLALI